MAKFSPERPGAVARAPPAVVLPSPLPRPQRCTAATAPSCRCSPCRSLPVPVQCCHNLWGRAGCSRPAAARLQPPLQARPKGHWAPIGEGGQPVAQRGTRCWLPLVPAKPAGLEARGARQQATRAPEAVAQVACSASLCAASTRAAVHLAHPGCLPLPQPPPLPVWTAVLQQPQESGGRSRPADARRQPPPGAPPRPRPAGAGGSPPQPHW